MVVFLVAEEQQAPGKRIDRMKKANRFFSEEQKALIQAAVSAAEKTTSGEIIPVVATQSNRYDRAEDIFGLFFAMITLVICWLSYERMAPIQVEWGVTQSNQLSLLPIITIVLIGFFLGTKIATMYPSLGLIFIAKKLMKTEVERCAIEAFHRFKLAETKDATGILIYVSLFEHMVTVLGDSGINEKIEPDNWQDICDIAIQGIKNGDPAEGLVNAIEQCGALLSKHFPIQPDDENELGNELQLIN